MSQKRVGSLVPVDVMAETGQQRKGLVNRLKDGRIAPMVKTAFLDSLSEGIDHRSGRRRGGDLTDPPSAADRPSRSVITSELH